MYTDFCDIFDGLDAVKQVNNFLLCSNISEEKEATESALRVNTLCIEFLEMKVQSISRALDALCLDEIA